MPTIAFGRNRRDDSHCQVGVGLCSSSANPLGRLMRTPPSDFVDAFYAGQRSHQCPFVVDFDFFREDVPGLLITSVESRYQHQTLLTSVL